MYVVPFMIHRHHHIQFAGGTIQKFQMEICNLSIVNNQIINNSDIVVIVIVLY